MAFFVRWSTPSSTGSSTHASLADAYTAEASKAAEIYASTEFTLTVDDGSSTYHRTVVCRAS